MFTKNSYNLVVYDQMLCDRMFTIIFIRPRFVLPFLSMPSTVSTPCSLIPLNIRVIVYASDHLCEHWLRLSVQADWACWWARRISRGGLYIWWWQRWRRGRRSRRSTALSWVKAIVPLICRRPMAARTFIGSL